MKNMNIRVYPPDGDVIISVPLRMPMSAIQRFLDEKIPWIEKQRTKIRSRIYEPTKEFITGERHTLVGRNYELLIKESDTRTSVLMSDEKLILTVPPGATREERRAVLERWLRRELKILIAEYIRKWEQIMGVSVREFGIKRMRTKWGTCSIGDRRIWLNLELGMISNECLEYVIVHEMVHLLERNHTARFVALMDRFLPNWRVMQEVLSRTSLRLLVV